MSRCIYCQALAFYIDEGISRCPKCLSLVATESRPRYKAASHAYRFSFFRPKLYFLRAKALRSGLKEGQTVCDLGCGAGHSLWWAKRRNCVTVGFDIPEACEHVRGCDMFFDNVTAL